MASWLVDEGAFVEMDEPICELETDKASQELYAEVSGIVHHVAEEGDDLPVGGLLCTIETNGVARSPKTTSTEAGKSEKEVPAIKAESPEEVSATPVALKILEENGIDPKSVKGSGAKGKVTKEDAVKAAREAVKEPKQEEKPKTAPAAESAVDTSSPVPSRTAFSREERREKLSRLRRTIGNRLVSVKNETAMLTTFNEVDMKPIMDLRAKYKERFKEKNGVSLGFMSFFTKAVCNALMDFPQVNSMIDGNEIVFHDFCDISIAVSAPQGLVVPVVRNAESLSMAEIEKEIKRLAIRARDGQLSLEEMSGGTFSITNGGVFGSMLSTPILNPPQSAILGMHNIVERPVAVEGRVEIRPVMYVALSYDHRIIDGKESVSFLYRVKEYLEDPTRMLIGI